VADVVLVPGAFHAGWYYDPIVPALRAAGHRVFAVTLTGLGDRRHLTNGAINLDTHIQDVVQLFEDERINDAVLVAHSYGGMVITGASDRLPGRIRSLVYLDAMVPSDGDAQWDLMSDAFHQAFLGNTADGLTTTAPPNVDPRACAHPLATMLQPLRIGTSAYDVANKTFVWAEGFVGSPFGGFYERLSETEGWETHRLPNGHDLLAEVPEVIADLVLAAADR
jgi:pimeloyl-ACP methyl ester carboxylesterase